MTFIESRNALIASLWKYLRCPVLLASQVQPEEEPPLVVYSVTTDYIPDGSLGHYILVSGAGAGEFVEVRAEQPSATFSFTACSINRCEEIDGAQVNILGGDEALELATRARGFFLHTGRYAIERAGFVVVEVTNATSRDALEVDEMGRRFGFDVRLRYTLTDAAPVAQVEKPNIIGNAKE